MKSGGWSSREDAQLVCAPDGLSYSRLAGTGPPAGGRLALLGLRGSDSTVARGPEMTTLALRSKVAR